MRILLDECLPRRLKDSIKGHDVSTVPEAGWAGLSNGDLLRKASGRFDVFITVDQGIRFQQNVTELKLAIVLLKARSNRLADLLPLVPEVLGSLEELRPGDVARFS